MIPLLLTLSTLCPAQLPSHESANPLYKELLDPGLLVGPNVRAKLPPPSMPDGLDAARQTAILKQLIGTDYSYEEFTRKSVVAPQLLRIRDVQPSDPKAPARGVDVYFVAHGDFAALDDEKFRSRLLEVGRGEGKGQALTREQLAKRKIELTPEQEKHESYGFIEFDFLEKVRIRATGRAVWSKNPESLVAAGQIDPRFLNDPDFPNDWRSISKGAGGVKVGPPHPWSGAGFYLKVTKLAQPAGALFLEQHVVFAEPTGWFEGANLLRSKLPPVTQNNVRNMRREWVKWPAK
jgi:hypothetical protein